MDLVVPALGESISEAVIGKWLKKVGETCASDEPVVDLETDKVSVQLPAPAGGVLVEQRFAEGATVKVGDVIGRIGEASAAARAVPPASATTEKAQEIMPEPAPRPPEKPPEPPPTVPREAAEAHGGDGNARLSPAQRRALREGGPAPRVTTPTSADSGPVAAVRAAAASPAPAPAPAAAHPREEIVAMSPLRKRIAERLVAAQHTAAILTTFNEVDMTNLLAIRARHQEAFVARHGIKLGFMSFFTKATVAALKDFPSLNAEVRGTDIVYKKHYDIGIAVGGGKGLVVPVMRDADRLDFAEIEKTIAALATRAKENKLTLEELSGGTFTITNGGIYGSMMSTPLLNLPQTGILGMHNVVKRAVVVGDQVLVRPMMYLALSYDHRLVDGREAVQFLVGVKERIENPDRMLFSL
jgi:2-oxoglutarate dehydrogenase E2 component (dihydrolipoamide succinyltransferase)